MEAGFLSKTKWENVGSVRRMQKKKKKKKKKSEARELFLSGVKGGMNDGSCVYVW
jgi:hypothetical protein